MSVSVDSLATSFPVERRPPWKYFPPWTASLPPRGNTSPVEGNTILPSTAIPSSLQ